MTNIRVDDDTNCTRPSGTNELTTGSNHINSIKSTEKYDNKEQCFIYTSISTKLPLQNLDTIDANKR